MARTMLRRFKAALSARLSRSLLRHLEGPLRKISRKGTVTTLETEENCIRETGKAFGEKGRLLSFFCYDTIPHEHAWILGRGKAAFVCIND